MSVDHAFTCHAVWVATLGGTKKVETKKKLCDGQAIFGRRRHNTRPFAAEGTRRFPWPNGKQRQTKQTAGKGVGLSGACNTTSNQYT